MLKSENQQDIKSKCKEHVRRAEKKNVSIVPSHLSRTDTSNVKGETLMFSNLMFYVAFVFLCLRNNMNFFEKF